METKSPETTELFNMRVGAKSMVTSIISFKKWNISTIKGEDYIGVRVLNEKNEMEEIKVPADNFKGMMLACIESYCAFVLGGENEITLSIKNKK